MVLSSSPCPLLSSNPLLSLPSRGLGRLRWRIRTSEEFCLVTVPLVISPSLAPRLSFPPAPLDSGAGASAGSSFGSGAKVSARFSLGGGGILGVRFRSLWAGSLSVPISLKRKMSSAAAPKADSLASKDGDGEKDTKTVNVVIKGLVQGVFFRNWTVEAAQELGVNGWVRNLKDDSVEAVFSGKPSVVNSLIDKCHSGPSSAKVTAVDVSEWSGDVPNGFEKKPSA